MELKNQYNISGQKDGYWEEDMTYWSDGGPKYGRRQISTDKGFYVNGEKEGCWESYTNDNNIFMKANYKAGYHSGKFEKWYTDSNCLFCNGEHNGKGSRCGIWNWFEYNGGIKESILYI